MLSGLFGGWVCQKIGLPRLFGMIIAGILTGPHLLDLIDPVVMDIAADIRKIALIIILLRAGLKLELKDLKKSGRAAVLMCFVPALFEIAGTVLIAPKILGLSYLDAAILGAVVGAVSPAVIVPGMIKLIDEGYGTKRGIPQMILAGASVDDIFVIVMFTAFTGLARGEKASVMNFVNIPISICVGIAAGVLISLLLVLYFGKMHIRDTVKTMIILSIAFLLICFEDKAFIPFASLIAIMCIGMGIRFKKPELAARLALKYDKMWAAAEVFLFVSIGAAVAVDSLADLGINAVALIFAALVFRMTGVFICLLGTKFNFKEKLFCMIAYTPKATVQAAIGALPLSMGLACGETVLTVSVAAILITAPLGALGIERTYKILL